MTLFNITATERFSEKTDNQTKKQNFILSYYIKSISTDIFIAQCAMFICGGFSYYIYELCLKNWKQSSKIFLYGS